MFICFAGEKNDDPNHPDYVPSQFSFLKSPVKAKMKRDLIRYHRSEDIKAKRLKSMVSHTKSSNIEDTEDLDDQEPDTSVAFLLESQHRDNPGEVRIVNESQDKDDNITQQLQCSSDEADSDDSRIQNVSTANSQDDLEEQQTDLCVAEPFFNDSVLEEPIVWNDSLQIDHKDTDEKGVQVDSTHLEFNEQSLQKDDKKVNFYTGLPNFATLKLLTELVTSGIEPNRGVLTAFQEICLVLIKLRLNLEEQDLAYRFGISQPTVSRVFRKWIAIMGQRLQPLIYWPERTELKESMPVAFRKFFPKCVCIIDCTEVFTERPSDLKARAQTWSNYKQHNTMKILIAVTPQGSISFVSKAWGGRVSDKYITEHSGILQKLLPGDLVLADRGFTIQDSVGFYCAEVKTPPFTKGKKQLSRREVDWSREISHVRIHVERVIGVLKQKYTILQGTIPITMLKDDTDCTIDNIVTTCAALCNLCVSTVPSN